MIPLLQAYVRTAEQEGVMHNLLNKKTQDEVARLIGDAAINVLAEKYPLSRDALNAVGTPDAPDITWHEKPTA